MKTSFSAMRGKIKPKSMPLGGQDLVKLGRLQADRELPVLVQPARKDVDLYPWVANNRHTIERILHTTGGILFRDFDTLRDHGDFERFLQAAQIPPMKYMEGATPRKKLAEGVFTSTEFPEDQIIAPHNELSYVTTWPNRIVFMCEIASRTGGETPIADVRRVLDHIDPAVLAPFQAKGWLLVRNFGAGFGPDWHTSFNVDTREELEAYCEGAEVGFEWLPNGILRTRQVRPVVTRHPVTGEDLWFNHLVFWHLSSLRPHQREVLEREFAPEDLPFNTYYGDGTPIPDEVIDHINEAYRKETVAFPWQVGDLLLLDNMLIAHGRNAYTGDRRILATLGLPQRRQDLAQV